MWPLVIMFALRQAPFTADAAPAYVVFFILLWLIWLAPAAQLVRWMESELRELLEHQAATAEVLKIISRSPFDLQAVLDTLVEAAARLCKADTAAIARQRDGSQYQAAHHGFRPDQIEYLSKLPLSPGRGSLVGRVLLEGGSVQIPDALADPEYAMTEAQKYVGFRTMLGVPLLREGIPIGVIVLQRHAVRPFTNKQVELVRTFADQAVIAIENARLFDEVQARTHELTDSLQQQTATADVLKIISRSTFDLQTVLETLTASAAQLCEADMATITRQGEGGALYYATAQGFPLGIEEYIKSVPHPPGRGSVNGRVLLEGRTIHLTDVLADPEYTHLELQRKAGFRTALGVPLLREGHPIGVVLMLRKTVRPFDDKQIDLITTFADQAVIAIENARLFDEIQDKSRQLEIASKYKSHFLASASHDLRQPLHALNLFVAQLRAETDPAERNRLVTRIDAAVSAMNELFGALLDMSKLDAGILEPNITEFPVDRVFNRIETTFAEAAREKGLKLRIVSSQAWIHSDFILLERMLLNLVSNAARYTTRGGIVIGCRRRGMQVRIDVCDTGPGIPEGERQNIFEEFYQLGAPAADRRGGLGLGLAIVDRLGRLLDHRIDMDSRTGRGSRFSIWVPLVERRSDIDVVPISSQALVDPAHGKLVFVIDDDPLVLDGMGGILRSWGCTIVCGDSPESALTKVGAQTQKPDLIISDYRLASGRTGIEAIQCLREALGADIPAFLITGDTAPERLRDASANGFHLLHKPVTPMRLRAMLNQLLKAHESDATGPAPRQPTVGRARPPASRLQ